MSASNATTPVTFAEIERYPGYRFGDDGTVWSCRTFQGSIGDTWKKLRGARHPLKYWRFAIVIDGRQRVFQGHRLILEAFIGPCPSGHEGCHNNGDRYDNRLSNLRWDTKSANQRDRRKHGTASFGMQHGRAKLCDEDIPGIRQLCRDGKSCREVAEMYGVAPNAVRLIMKGINWSHVKEPMI